MENAAGSREVSASDKFHKKTTAATPKIKGHRVKLNSISFDDLDIIEYTSLDFTKCIFSNKISL